MVQNKLISYFVVLGVTDINIYTLEESKNLKVIIEDKYPIQDYENAPIPELLPMFCYPSGAKISTTMRDPKFFCFTLTELSGERFYGAALQFDERYIPSRYQAERILVGQTNENQQDEEYDDESETESDQEVAKLYIPKSFVILSRHAFFSTFRECLKELYLLFKTQNMLYPIENVISYMVDCIPLPPPSTSIEFQIFQKKIQLSLPPVNFFTPLDFSITIIFEKIGIKGVIEIVSSLLGENKVLFCSKHYTLLTLAAETVIRLLFPFEWHHIYIPILPIDLLEFLEAPTPYIIGIHIDILDSVQDIPGLMIVDLDNGTITNENNVILPPVQTQKLTKTLEKLLHPQLHDMDAAFSVPQPLYYNLSGKSNSAIEPSQGDLYLSNQIRLEFLKFFIELFKDFRGYISYLRKFPQPVTIFNKAKFIKDSMQSAVEFLSMIIETQAFTMLLDHHQDFTIFEIVSKAMIENLPLSEVWNFAYNMSRKCFVCIPPISSFSENVMIPIEDYSDLHGSCKKKRKDHIFPKLNEENYLKNLPKDFSHYFNDHSHKDEALNFFNKFKHTTSSFEGSTSSLTDPANAFIEETLQLIVTEQVIPKESIFLLCDLLRVDHSRLVVTKFLKSYSDKMKGTITDLSFEYFNHLSDITDRLLEEAKSANDFTSPAILMASSGSFRLLKTEEFIHQRYKKHSIFHNKYFWESAFFESVARERESLPDLCKVGISSSIKWEDLQPDTQIDFETKESNILFGLLGSFAMHMLNLGISDKEASNFLHQMSRLCDLASQQVQELQTLVATMHKINDMMTEDLELPNDTQKHDLKESNQGQVRLEYFATSSSNENFDSKSLYRRLMEQKVKKETQQFTVEKEKRHGFLIRTLRGYKKGISCMALHYPILATGEVNGAITIWNLIDNQTLNHKFSFHVDRITAMIINQSFLICSSVDSNISVWNVETGDLEYKFTLHSEAVTCIYLHGKQLVSGSDDTSLRVWNLKTGECKHTLKGHTESITSVKMENSFIVSSSKDKTAKIWDDFTCKNTLSKHNDWVKLIDFNDTIIVSASYDTTICIWDRPNGQHLRTLVGHTGIVNSVELSYHYLVSGSSDNTVRIWDISTGELLNVCMESDGGDEISSVKFHPNGYEVIAGGFDGFIRIWNIKTGKLSNCLTGHSDWVYTLLVHLSDMNNTNSSGKLDRKSKDKKVKEKEKVARKNSLGDSGREPQPNMQTFMIISGSWDNTVKIWEQNILRQSKKKTKRNFKFWK